VVPLGFLVEITAVLSLGLRSVGGVAGRTRVQVSFVHELEPASGAFFLVFGPDRAAIGAIVRFVFNHGNPFRIPRTLRAFSPAQQNYEEHCQDCDEST